jgi:hypothetical protein
MSFILTVVTTLNFLPLSATHPPLRETPTLLKSKHFQSVCILQALAMAMGYSPFTYKIETVRISITTYAHCYPPPKDQTAVKA